MIKKYFNRVVEEVRNWIRASYSNTIHWGYIVKSKLLLVIAIAIVLLVSLMSTTFATAAPPVEKIKPHTTASASPGPNSAGWNNGAVTVTLTATDDGGSGVKSITYWVDLNILDTHTVIANSATVTLSDNGRHTLYFYARDNAGNRESTGQIDVNIDKTAPIVIAVSDPLLPDHGWYTSPVTFSVRNLFTFDVWSGIPNRPDDQVITEGKEVPVHFEVADRAGNIGKWDAKVNVDYTAPTTTCQEKNLWFNGDAEITLNANDATSGVSETRYSFDPSVKWKEMEGYNPSSKPVIHLSDVGSGGSETIYFRSQDNAGNRETQQSATVYFDTDAPTITVSPVPSADWYTTSPTFHFTYTDSLSGLKETSPADVKVADTKGYALSAYAIDNAKNRNDWGPATVKVDTTKPSISGARDRAPNAQNWYNAPVTVTFTASDATSDVAKVDPPSVKKDAEGEGQSATSVATDNAGNTESATVGDINIDMTVPATSASLSGTTGTGGWYTGDVTVTLTATDGLSGVKNKEYSTDSTTWKPYNAPVTFSSEGTTTVYFRSTDNADNTETAKSVNFNLDKTAPVSSAVLSGTPGNNGWYVSDVKVTLSATDAGSAGVAATEYSTDGTTWKPYTAPVTISADGQTTVSYRSTDNAGNLEAVKQISFKIDKTAPALSGTLSGDRSMFGWFTGDATLALNYGDSTSGISSVMYSLDGSSWSVYTGSVKVPKAGSHNVYFGAIDNAGNRQNGSAFAYFPPGSYEYLVRTLDSALNPTPTATPTPTPTPGTGSGTGTQVATPSPSPSVTPTVTPTVTVTPEPTTVAQTQPGNNWWIYLAGILVLALGLAGAFFLLRKH